MDIDDLAERQRLQSTAKAKRIAQRRTDVAFWDGSAATLGDQNALPTTVSSNGPLRSGQNVRLLQSAGINQADTFSRTEQLEIAPVRLSKEGNVKVCLSVFRPNGDIEYWIGGDRKTPILAYTLAVTENANVSLARFESTGDTPDKWILALKLNSKESTRGSRLIAIFGTAITLPDNSTGTVLDSGWNKKYVNYGYYGNAFWSLPDPIIPSFALDTSNYSTNTGAISLTRLRSIEGNVQVPSGQIAWNDRFVDLINPGQTSRTSTSGSSLLNFSISSTEINLQPSLSYSDSNISQTDWSPPPVVTGYDELYDANPGGNNILPCISRITATSTEGRKIGSQRQSRQTSATANTYSGSFSRSGQSDKNGTYHFSVDDQYQRDSEIWEGFNTVSFTDCFENVRIINNTSDQISTNESTASESSSSSQSYSWQSSIVVAPGIEKLISYNASYQISDGNFLSRELAVTGNYAAFKLFNNGQSYIYKSFFIDAFGIPIYDNKLTATESNYAYPNSITSQDGTFINLAGSDQPISLSGIGSASAYSWIVADGELELYLYSPINSQYQTFQKDQKIDIAVSKLVNGFFITPKLCKGLHFKNYYFRCD